jgi:putative cardiolipin synthase
VAPLLAVNPGKTGIFPLVDGQDAFAARVLLAEAAERTLDVQYYIWHNDITGTLLFDALRRAADRGVRVRLLLDDNNTAGLDEVLAELDAHPNLEVRLFNPFNRSARLLGYIVDFVRVNRRMHNKSFTADHQATIVGGRNVADEYFSAGANRAFVDLDVLAVGPVAEEVSRDFDRYWASESSYPAERILPSLDATEVARTHRAAAEIYQSAAAAPYLRAVAERPRVRSLLAGTLALDWSHTRLVSDDPAKIQDRAKAATLLWPQMKQALGSPRTSLGLVSAYFVPTQTGTEGLAAFARQGVKVRVLTNAL